MQLNLHRLGYMNFISIVLSRVLCFSLFRQYRLIYIIDFCVYYAVEVCDYINNCEMECGKKVKEGVYVNEEMVAYRSGK